MKVVLAPRNPVDPNQPEPSLRCASPIPSNLLSLLLVLGCWEGLGWREKKSKVEA